jgi:hypothetical protein
MGETKAIIDTNVLYAGLYSSRGVSYRVLRAFEHGIVRIALSTTLLFEYEDILKRNQTILNLSDAEIEAILDDLCSRSDHQESEICLDIPGVELLRTHITEIRGCQLGSNPEVCSSSTKAAMPPVVFVRKIRIP